MATGAHGFGALTPNSPLYRWVGPAAHAWLPGLGIDLVMLAVAAAYGYALYRAQRPIERKLAVRFYSGVALVMVVLSGPLERLALERSFSTYIFQQVVLVMFAAPLILSGLPAWMLRRALTHRLVAPVWRVLVRPVFAMLLFAGFFATIHYPTVCDYLCHTQPFYFAIRVTLLTLGVLMWWPILSPLEEFPPLSYPMQTLYLFVLMVPISAVAAPIVLSRSVLYAFFAAAPHPLISNPFYDQVIGGLIMWVGQGLFVMGVATRIFLLWFAEDMGSEVNPAPAHKDSPIYQAGKS